MSDDIIVGLDIGSKNIRVVVAEKNDEGHLQITGIGMSESTGIHRVLSLILRIPFRV